jgi:hypothetical protein
MFLRNVRLFRLPYDTIHASEEQNSRLYRLGSPRTQLVFLYVEASPQMEKLPCRTQLFSKMNTVRPFETSRSDCTLTEFTSQTNGNSSVRVLKTHGLVEEQFHEFLILTPDGSARSASGSDRFIPSGLKIAARSE